MPQENTALELSWKYMGVSLICDSNFTEEISDTKTEKEKKKREISPAPLHFRGTVCPTCSIQPTPDNGKDK